MKKHTLLICAGLLALGATSATPALAQSKVSVYGLVDMSAGAAKNPGAADYVFNADSGKMSTSYIGFSGNEELGGGLAAFFTLDSFLRADSGGSGRFNGDAFWARNAFVGLSSQELGLVRVGRNTTPLFVATLSFNAFGDSFGYSPAIRHIFTSGTVSGDSGWSDSVQYVSPKFAGASFGLITAAGEGAGKHNWGANANYSAGPFAASLVYQDVGKDGSSSVPMDDTKTWQLGASFDIGMAKLFGQWSQVENVTTGRDYKIGGVGAAVPIGEGKILAQYGKISASSGPDRQTYSLGYDYALSKRTDIYAVGMSDEIDKLSAGLSYSVGIRHRF